MTYTDMLLAQLETMEKVRDDWRKAYHALLNESDRLNENGRKLNRWIAEHGRGVDEVLVDMATEMDELRRVLREIVSADNHWRITSEGEYLCIYCNVGRGHLLDCPIVEGRKLLANDCDKER